MDVFLQLHAPNEFLIDSNWYCKRFQRSIELSDLLQFS